MARPSSSKPCSRPRPASPDEVKVESLACSSRTSRTRAITSMSPASACQSSHGRTREARYQVGDLKVRVHRLQSAARSRQNHYDTRVAVAKQARVIARATHGESGLRLRVCSSRQSVLNASATARRRSMDSSSACRVLRDVRVPIAASMSRPLSHRWRPPSSSPGAVDDGMRHNRPTRVAIDEADLWQGQASRSARLLSNARRGAESEGRQRSRARDRQARTRK